MRFIHQGKWLSYAQWGFLVNLIKSQKIVFSPQTEQANQRKVQSFIEYQIDVILVSLLQLIPPGECPSSETIEGLKEVLPECTTKFSTYLSERSLMGFLPLYEKALQRVVYQTQQHAKLRPTRRKRSSEDSSSAKSHRSRGPKLVSQLPISTSTWDPWIEYPTVRDTIIRSISHLHTLRTGNPLAGGIQKYYF